MKWCRATAKSRSRSMDRSWIDPGRLRCVLLGQAKGSNRGQRKLLRRRKRGPGGAAGRPWEPFGPLRRPRGSNGGQRELLRRCKRGPGEAKRRPRGSNGGQRGLVWRYKRGPGGVAGRPWEPFGSLGVSSRSYRGVLDAILPSMKNTVFPE